MGKRLIRWLTYSVVFALLPLVSSVLLRYFSNQLTIDSMTRSPEVLFFSLMLNATALGDLADIARPKKQHELTVSLFRSALLIGAVFSGILYGSLLFGTVVGNVKAEFLQRLFTVSVVIALASFVMALVSEVFLSRVGK
ncbi:MAG: hypothetical protein H6821_01010 [Planctomycetaceae bacterium]|nr:hypothetical protein [Planctomycetales bacterium]MCB9872730.1 hypothetical protein [Planctomycetaceae bacterium]MCB9926216.1 hypothetical protein [Planctomycetaceae bacterium]